MNSNQEVKNLTACFFAREGIDHIKKEQYTLQDIRILENMGFSVTISNRYLNTPWDSDLYLSWWASGSIIPFIKAKILNKPIIVIAGGNEAMLHFDSHSGEPIGYLQTSWYKKIATRIVLRNCSILCVVSRHMVEDVKKLSGRNPDVVYNSVDTNTYCIDKDIEKSYITTVINLQKEAIHNKRLLNLLRAFQDLLKKDTNQMLVIIGKHGDAYEDVIKVIKEYGIVNNVKLVGYIDNKKMPRWLQKSKCYIQISDTETFGVTVAEAMSCGVPVVVSNRGALKELVGPLGIKVDHNNIEDIMRGISKALSYSSDKCEKVGIGLRNRIIEKYSFHIREQKMHSVIKSNLFALYKRTIGESR